MSRYESDASELFSNGKLLKGTAAITAELTANSAQWAHLVISPNTPYTISGDIAIVIGTTATHVPGPGGQTLTIPGAYIATLHRSAGVWKLSTVAAIPDSATVAGMAAAAAKPAPKWEVEVALVQPLTPSRRRDGSAGRVANKSRDQEK